MSNNEENGSSSPNRRMVVDLDDLSDADIRRMGINVETELQRIRDIRARAFEMNSASMTNGNSDSVEAEEEEEEEASTSGMNNTASEDEYSEEDSTEDEDENEISDSGLLRSMLKDSEEYYKNRAATEAQEEKHCWVCFATEEDDPDAPWVHPCRCRGTTKWVHQHCIQRWVDIKQSGRKIDDVVECPNCTTPFVIRLPKGNFLVSILDSYDNTVRKISPIIVAGVCVGAVVWSSVTFGAVTLMQVVGHDEGLMLMERTDPLLILVSLTMVPWGLVSINLIRWDNLCLRFLRRTVPKTPIVRNLLPVFTATVSNEGINSRNGDYPPVDDGNAIMRTFIGALVVPSAASLLGGALFGGSGRSQLKCTLMGGLTYLAVSGALSIYHKQHSYVRWGNREIADFVEPPAPSTSVGTSTSN